MPKIKKYITDHNLFVPTVLLTVFSVLLSIIVIAALMMRPVADDFAYFSDPSIHNPVSFAVHYYFDWTGRFMQALWMSSLFKVFNSHVVIYGTILQLVLLAASAVFCTYSLLHKTKIQRLWIITIGFAITTFFAYMSPSFFDTNLWITSSSVYLGSAIGLLLAAGLAALAVASVRIKWWHYIGLGATIFLAQLFSEPTSIIMVYMGVAAVGVSYLIKAKHAHSVSWLWLSTSIAGFLFMYLSPGTSARQGQLQIHPSVYETISGAVHSLDKLSYIFTSYRVWLIVLAGAIIAPLLVKLSVRYRIYVLATSSVSALLIPLSLFIATQYTMNGYVPLRALTIPSGLFAFCLIAIIGILLSWIFTRVKQFPLYAISVIACFLIVPAAFAAVTASIPTLQAIAMRMNPYDAREISIRQQMDTGQQTITIDPLPLLLDSTEALDMNYNNNTPTWLTDSFHTYYGIPRGTTIVHNTQPRGYCLTSKNPAWFGTKTCAELESTQ